MLAPAPQCAGRKGKWGRPVERAGWPEYPAASVAADWLTVTASRPSSQPGPRIVAPAATHLSRSSRSAVTTTRRPGSSRTTATIASSPEPARLHHAHLPRPHLARSRRLARLPPARAAAEMRAAAALAAPSSDHDEPRRPAAGRSAGRADRPRRAGPRRADRFGRQDRAAAGGQPGHLGVQPDRGAGPVPPPAVGTRAHHVGDVHDDCDRVARRSRSPSHRKLAAWQT